MRIHPLLTAAGIAVLALSLAACERPRPVIEIDGRAMGTSWHVQLVEPPAATDPAAVAETIAATLESVEDLASTYRPASALSRLNAAGAGEWQPVPAELCRLIANAVRLGAATDGAYDVTVGPLVDLWGFGPGGDVGALPDPARIDALLKRIGYTRLDVDCNAGSVKKRVPGLQVDLSSSAKGYGVDRVAERLAAEGFDNFLVEVGGEIRVHGSNRDGEAFRLLVEHPADSDPAAGLLLRLTDTALATSGDYRNVFVVDGRRYSHAIDPRTGYPVDASVASVSVVAANAERADALATALLIMGEHSGFAFAEANGIAAVFQLRDGDGIRRRASSAFAALQAEARD